MFVYGCFFYLNGEVCSESMYRISENKEYYNLIGRYAEKRTIVDKYGGVFFMLYHGKMQRMFMIYTMMVSLGKLMSVQSITFMMS